MYVYVLRRDNSSKIKVGKSDNIESRIASYCTEDPEMTMLIVEVRHDIESDVIKLFIDMSMWHHSECIALAEKYQKMSVMELWTEALMICPPSVFMKIDAAIDHDGCYVLDSHIIDRRLVKRRLEYKRVKRYVDEAMFDDLNPPHVIKGLGDDYFRDDACEMICSMIPRLVSYPRHYGEIIVSIETIRSTLGPDTDISNILLAYEVLEHRHSLLHVLPLEKIDHLIDSLMLWYVLYHRSLSTPGAGLEYIVRSLKQSDFGRLCQHIKSLESHIRKDMYIRDSDHLTCDTYDIVRFALGMYTVEDVIRKTVVPQSTVRRHLSMKYEAHGSTLIQQRRSPLVLADHVLGVPTYWLPHNLKSYGSVLKCIKGPCSIVKVMSASRDTNGFALVKEDQLMIETPYHVDVPGHVMYRSCRGHEYQLTSLAPIDKSATLKTIVDVYKNRLVTQLVDKSIIVMTESYAMIGDIIYKL